MLNILSKIDIIKHLQYNYTCNGVRLLVVGEWKKIMKDGLRKVVHVEVFDFDSDTFAYAKDTQKNQFGYKYTTQYLQKGKVVKSEEVNNVEKGAYYYNKLGININQLNSLRRLVKKVQGKKTMFPFEWEDGSIEAVIRGGSTITYRGENKEDFYQKVLKIR